jgi:hypothetical protein
MENGYAICFNEWALDKSIKSELGLLLIISNLTSQNGYCFASNSYFSKIFEVDEVSISRKIKKLTNKGYVTLEYERHGCQITNRKIRLTKMLIHDLQKSQSTINKNVKDNITSNNIININSDALLNFPDIPLINKKEKVKKSSEFSHPKKEDVIQFFIEKGYSKESGETAFNYYDVADWNDARGNKVKNWKQKMISVWFKPENKENKNNSENKGFNIGDY